MPNEENLAKILRDRDDALAAAAEIRKMRVIGVARAHAGGRGILDRNDVKHADLSAAIQGNDDTLACEAIDALEREKPDLFKSGQRAAAEAKENEDLWQRTWGRLLRETAGPSTGKVM